MLTDKEVQAIRCAIDVVTYPEYKKTLRKMISIPEDQWRAEYVQALILHADISEQEAMDHYETGNPGHDFSLDPETEAVNSIECWDAP